MALSESRRAQLDGIVQQMVKNKEPDTNVQFVVNDFKKKYESETAAPVTPTLPPAPTAPSKSLPAKMIDGYVQNFQQAKGVAKVVGKALVGIAKPVVQTAVQFPQTVAGSALQLPEDIRSYATQTPVKQTPLNTLGQKAMLPKRVPVLGEVQPLSSIPKEASALRQLGQAAEMGSLVIGGGAISSTGKAAAKGAAGKAIAQGVFSGAETGLYSGIGQAAQKPNVTQKELITGALAGAGMGALAGGVGAKVLTKFAKVPQSPKLKKDVLDLITPQLSKAEKTSAIASGRGITKTFKGSVLAPTPREIEAANVVSSIVKPKKGLIENVNLVRSGIAKEADTLSSKLKQSNIPIPRQELESRLSSIERPIALQSDQKLNNSFNLAQEKFLKFVDESDGTAHGVLEARKKFDSWIEGQIPKIWEENGVYKPVHDALRKMRSSANDIIAEKATDIAVKKSLLAQNLMYEAVDNMSAKAAQELGEGFIKRFVRKHPFASATAGAIAGNKVYGIAKDALTGK